MKIHVYHKCLVTINKQIKPKKVEKDHYLSKKEEKKLMAALEDLRVRRGNRQTSKQKDKKQQTQQNATIAGKSNITSQTVLNKTNRNLQRDNQYNLQPLSVGSAQKITS